MPESVVLLHGFSGTHRAWDGVVAQLDPERYRPLALDLPGHGQASDYEPPITFAGCVAYVLHRSPRRFVLGGYSLGGRLALHVALAAPHRVQRLVLVSSTAGIVDTAQRAARRESDELLAAQLEEETIEQFSERWRAQALFADEPPEVRALALADQRRNRPAALAAVLRGIGAGQMQPLWDELGRLEMPVSVLAGERDARYQALGRQMAALLPDASLQIVRGGHALALENPQAVAAALQGLDAEPGA